jgi:peroxiredoxin
MLDVGDTVPDFTLPKAGGEVYNDIGSFTLSAELGDGPLVLAFFPAAFTSGCTEEMCTFRDEKDRFDELDADVYGISVDLPTAQNVWMQREGLNFQMLSDWDHELSHEFGVVLPDMYGEFEAAKRSIFVLDAEGTITYRWVEPDGKTDFDAVIDEVHTAVAEATSS